MFLAVILSSVIHLHYLWCLCQLDIYLYRNIIISCSYSCYKEDILEGKVDAKFVVSDYLSNNIEIC